MSDHVPPRYLYRGNSGRNYEHPEVITVPACKAHNAQMSAFDEALGWFLTADAAINSAGHDVVLRQYLAVAEMTSGDFSARVKRLYRHGIREIRNAEDCDSNGLPRRKEYTKEYCDQARQKCHKDWDEFSKGIQKVAAGLHFHATDCGVSLGEKIVDHICVYSPDMKQLQPANWLCAPPIDETAFFSSWSSRDRKQLRWKSIVSGSPEVFTCEHAWRKSRPNRFALKMTFYGAIRGWVTSFT
jgi:hypothetical protein